jgi:hypothetical protein
MGGGRFEWANNRPLFEFRIPNSEFTTPLTLHIDRIRDPHPKFGWWWMPVLPAPGVGYRQLMQINYVRYNKKLLGGWSK